MVRLLAALLLSGFAAGTAAALPPQLEERFRALDMNGDGFLRLHEAWLDRYVLRRFELADLNHDGWLERSEFLVLFAGCDRAPAC